MKWDEKQLQLFLNGHLMNETELSQTINSDGSNPFSTNKRFYILLNLALGSNGGDPSNSEFPISYEIDYVRVYKINK